jgi:hypothetical protein
MKKYIVALAAMFLVGCDGEEHPTYTKTNIEVIGTFGLPIKDVSVHALNYKERRGEGPRGTYFKVVEFDYIAIKNEVTIASGRYSRSMPISEKPILTLPNLYASPEVLAQAVLLDAETPEPKITPRVYRNVCDAVLADDDPSANETLTAKACTLVSDELAMPYGVLPNQCNNKETSYD